MLIVKFPEDKETSLVVRKPPISYHSTGRVIGCGKFPLEMDVSSERATLGRICTAVHFIPSSGPHQMFSHLFLIGPINQKGYQERDIHHPRQIR